MTGSVDAILVGELRSCRQEESCSGGACYRGICTGLVDADALWLQQQLGDRLLARVEGDQAARDDLLAKLGAIALAPTRAALVRSRAVAFSARLGGERAVELLRTASGDAEAPVRYRALLGLASLGHGDVVADLAPLAEDPSEPVRAELARSLGPAGTEEAVHLLRALAERDDAAAVRIAAVRALGQSPVPSARDALEAITAGGPGYLHHDAVVALRGARN
ncbi:MAG: hypothetical protein AMXMBFR64_21730 [Myxococcales bacterium]